ncbi:MAG: cytochrome, partial [Labilithrix sp.]|nr:cytochrome [Labilithrix sp.]
MQNIDFFSREFINNPVEMYRKLREQPPVFWSEQLQSWVLTRYKDVFAALKDLRLSVAYGDYLYLGLPEDLLKRFQPYRKALESFIVFTDPPTHTRLRTIMHKPFTPQLVARVGERAGQIAEELLANVRPGESVDVRHGFAAILPAAVIAELIGAPREDCERLMEFSKGMLHFFGRAPNDVALAERSLEGYFEMANYFRQLFEACRKETRPTFLKPLLSP